MDSAVIHPSGRIGHGSCPVRAGSKQMAISLTRPLNKPVIAFASASGGRDADQRDGGGAPDAPHSVVQTVLFHDLSLHDAQGRVTGLETELVEKKRASSAPPSFLAKSPQRNIRDQLAGNGWAGLAMRS
jgi:hypothetical protein